MASTPATPVPDEWVAWAFAVMATAIATPFNDDWNPLKDNPKYLEVLRETRASFELELLSGSSPSYQKAYAICRRHVQLVSEAWKPTK
jgi:hypothetical protein